MRAATITLALACVLLTAGCATAASTSASSDPAAIVQERCTKCHNIDRIKAANHDAAGWTATVARMKGKGAQLSTAEAAAVVSFLAGGGGSKL